MSDVLRLPDQLPPPARKRRRPLPPLLVDARKAARLVDVGLRTWRTLDAAGKVPQPLRLNSRVLWSVRELREWIAAGAPPRDEWVAIKAAAKK